MLTIQTLDAHTGGEPLRLIIRGFPEPQGATMLERREWLRENHDDLRTAIMLEPRGHADMYGALLTPPERPDSDAGVLFMHNEGYSTMCGHGVIAVATLIFERGLLETRQPDVLVLDTPAGPIPRARDVDRRDGRIRVRSVSFRNVPSFVLHAGIPVRVNGRDLRADVAFGGAFYAIVDSEAAGIPVIGRRLDDLRRAGMAIKHAVEPRSGSSIRWSPRCRESTGRSSPLPRPTNGRISAMSPMFADAEVDRSPCGTGTCAVMAVLSAMGLLAARADVHSREHHREPVPGPSGGRSDGG